MSQKHQESPTPLVNGTKRPTPDEEEGELPEDDQNLTPKTKKRRTDTTADISNTENGVIKTEVPEEPPQRIPNGHPTPPPTSTAPPATPTTPSLPHSDMDTTDHFPEVRNPKNKRVLEEERTNRVMFKLVQNDGTRESLTLLSKVKAVIQAQLPKMPREYIGRVVYSREHWSCVVVRDTGDVVGGITFRPFGPRRFAEIVFLAVLSHSQTTGYGARLVAHFKDHVRAMWGVEYLLTYADNLAIGFFKKQGFTSEITLEKSKWVGYIKDYEGATLLQCSFFPKVKYLDIYHIYHAHRKAVFTKIKEASLSTRVYPGLVFEEGQAKIEPEGVPGLREAGWRPELGELSGSSSEGKPPLYHLLAQLLSELRDNPSAWPFREPVSGVADYYDIIRNPMDLATMEHNLKDGKYTTISEFETDFALIISNAKIYNDETTTYYKAACKLDKACKDRVKALVAAANAGKAAKSGVAVSVV
ncbi:uncharacterized protein EV422DRAFT_561146 [Fimicolochytrium jonesii]|uniref:uncharacterized protein n=1 Tax=Fimicolochytrium jonesii TaxID=1396493 RepID=UPI0022FE1A81|nr:uncharacterized protein EV422DRAFT_561146 [Fimicolochytrium jonesii]KAI8816991.1 hypothetical protein EV422DRAFT_561146 [Fimicolochytrium jonesii]